MGTDDGCTDENPVLIRFEVERRFGLGHLLVVIYRSSDPPGTIPNPENSIRFPTYSLTGMTVWQPE